jgi:cytochrome c oxidase subunit 2
MILAIALVLLVVGSVLFHFLSPWYFTPIASNWSSIDDTISITFWVTGSVFVAVNLFMAYCVVRYRHRKGSRAHYEPENKKLEGWLVGLTTVGIVGMLAPGLLVWAKFVEVPHDAALVEAMGQQWHWGFRFAGQDGAMGTVDARYINAENPFGINPDDPHGQDDVLISSPELHLPMGRPFKVLLRSIDVLHDFAVPQFRVKMDLVPGLVTCVWFTPGPGSSTFCEELWHCPFTMRSKS